MTTQRETVIVTGASQGIGAAVANLFLERGYNVVANSRRISTKNELLRADNVALVDGDIALTATADQQVAVAIERFGSIDALVNNAGIFFTKAFTDYTAEDFRALSATNLDGFIHISQRVIKQLLAQKRGGSVVTITASIADHPLAPLTASVPMITKGGLNAITRSLAAWSLLGVREVAPSFGFYTRVDGVERARTASELDAHLAGFLATPTRVRALIGWSWPWIRAAHWPVISRCAERLG